MSSLSIRFVLTPKLTGVLSLSSCRFCPSPDDKPIVLGVACLLEPQPCCVGGGGRAGGWAEMGAGGGRFGERVMIRVYINIFKAA